MKKLMFTALCFIVIHFKLDILLILGMHDNHTLRHIQYLIAKPDSLAVLLWPWSTISIGNTAR